MKITDIGEFEFIERIRSGCLVRPDGVILAIGDDAAAFEPIRDHVTLFTTDLLVEHVHFLRDTISGFNLGYKALAVNLSDIAAMGGIAREAFISIAIPSDYDIKYLDDLYSGIRHLAGRYEVNVLGGDTTGSPSGLVINIGVVGSVSPDCILTRSAAKPGDWIFATGSTGESRAGLHMILNGIQATSDDDRALYDTHTLPHPYLAEGRFLSECDAVHAAIDVSDGLASDLSHILTASRVGVRIRREGIPISPRLERFCDKFGLDALDYTLNGGEDYVLLVTIAASHAEGVRLSYEKHFSTPLIPIGEITDDACLKMADAEGRVATLSPGGWDHFKKGH